MSDLLFEPIKIGSLLVKNRIFMPAMHLNMCRNHMVTEQLIAFYRERAKGGAGLISVGYATVDELSGAPGNIGAHADGHIAGLALLATAIHEHGGKAAVQLNHAGRYNASFFLGGGQPVAPSAVPSRLTGETPRALESEEIDVIISRFADAAVRVREAGYDLVEILAGTGYLISGFLSPLTNKREDQYGGSLENRMRFGIEVIQAVRERLGASFPLMVRINGNDFMDGGIGPVDLRAFARSLVEAGVDALCVNVGWHEARVPQIVTKVPRGVYAYLARDIKKQVAVPVIASHRINDPITARRLLGEQYCDMVAIGRGLIADPEFPNKARQGREESIVHCVACGQGCFDNLFKMRSVACLCNPQAGNEYNQTEERTGSPKDVLVVGGGAAGMYAALGAADKGHRVRILEQTRTLGGQLLLAGAPPGRSEFVQLAEDLSRQLADRKVEVSLNVCVDHTLLDERRPDNLILATGGRPALSPIPGADLPHVVQAWEVLAGTRQVGTRVVIIGGGAVGVETALFLAEQGTLSGEELKFLLVNGAEDPEELQRLATDSGREITMVEMIDSLGTNFGKSTRWGMLQDVERYGIDSHLATRVTTISETAVCLENEGQQWELETDTVVLAVGTESHNPLEAAAEALGIPCQVVGDAHTPATVFEASHQGFIAGRGL